MVIHLLNKVEAIHFRFEDSVILAWYSGYLLYFFQLAENDQLSGHPQPCHASGSMLQTQKTQVYISKELAAPFGCLEMVGYERRCEYGTFWTIR